MVFFPFGFFNVSQTFRLKSFCCCESIKRDDQNAHQRGLVQVINRLVLTRKHHEAEKEVAIHALHEMKKRAGFNVGLKQKTICTMIHMNDLKNMRVYVHNYMEATKVWNYRQFAANC